MIACICFGTVEAALLLAVTSVVVWVKTLFGRQDD